MSVTLLGVSLALTVGVWVCQKVNPEWDYLYGTAFFALLPAGVLAEDGVWMAVGGYSLGMTFLILFTLIAFGMERVLSGEWQKPAV